MSKQKTTYEQRGVSSSKADVHRAIAKLDKGIFPGAFCKILPDILAGNPRHCNILHADTAGTKAGLAWLAWKNSGDLELVKGIAIDALVMNVDGVACVGATNNLIVNQTIGRNAFLVPGEVVEALIQSAQSFCERLGKWGIECRFAGGETASVGDIVRTLDIGSSIAARMKRCDVIDAGRMNYSNVIVGFSSTGQAKWEHFVNSGIGANGLTNARHDVLSKYYRRFKETYAPQIKKCLVYRGTHRLEDRLPTDAGFTIRGALLSPTRTYLPLIKMILETVGRRHIHGIIHCSGGGQTKIGKFGRPGNVYVKDNLFVTPPVFRMLQVASQLPWHEMYQTYNMGHRLEMVVPNMTVAEECIAISRSCDIGAQVVGRVKHMPDSKHRVIVESQFGTFSY
jgi:phosphoribosylformylglycinamidine cyclo-ligase